jgi:hypothetical protein
LLRASFIDTQIFLHFTFFTDIDWSAVADASEVTIMMPPIVLRELEKHKYNQKDETLRRRAENASAKLAELFRSGEEVRPRARIIFEAKEPDDEFSAHRLSRETQDDHLLASICLYRREHSDEDILLITNDMPLQVKAAPLAIETRELPAKYRLPVEPDPNVKKIREIERQMRELTQRLPRPVLRFSNGQNRLEFKAPVSAAPVRSVAERMEAVKRKYPKMEVPSPPPPPLPRPENSDPYEVVIRVNLYEDDKPRQRDVEEYNEALDSFYEEYERYLVALDKAKDLNARKVELKIRLENSGTAPVEDAVIFMSLPGNLRLTQDKTIFKYPSTPKPPELPKPRSRSALDDWYRPPRPSEIFLPPRPTTYVEPPNVERNDFSYGEKYHQVSFTVRRATHGLVYDCPYDTFIILESLEAARSFKIEYQIVAANIPKPVEDALHVIVKREVAEGGVNPPPATTPEQE